MSKKDPLLPDEIRELLSELDVSLERREQAYHKFVESIRDYGPLEKAEAWLTYVAENGEDYSDQEALVYLRSRGQDCSKPINKLILDWKRAARHAIQECADGISVHNTDTGKTAKAGRMSLTEASDIRNLSPVILRNFWECRDEQELSIDATMLRTVEWCDIGGFDEWWERLAEETMKDIILGGLEPVPASFWLFNMCRSDYAIQLIRRALERTLESLEIPTYREPYPWRIPQRSGKASEKGWQSVDHLAYASTVVFANLRLRGKDWNSRLAHEALNCLLREQDEHGAWHYWSGAKSPSVEATAMCLHAVTMGRPRGWERVASLAAEWLWANQHADGCWTDRAAPDPVFLTVLVMDALELAQGGSRVTFSLPDHLLPAVSARGVRELHARPPRFKVALSFPGEVREIVEPIAELLAQRFGREGIFYDKYYEDELARPNLDVYLQNIYHNESELVAVFLSSDYARKEWCGLEWRAVRDLIKRRRDEEIMLFRLDDTEIPGVFSIDGYIDVKGRQSVELADLISERVGR